MGGETADPPPTAESHGQWLRCAEPGKPAESGCPVRAGSLAEGSAAESYGSQSAPAARQSQARPLSIYEWWSLACGYLRSQADADQISRTVSSLQQPADGAQD